jgi:hypothetical protein
MKAWILVVAFQVQGGFGGTIKPSLLLSMALLLNACVVSSDDPDARFSRVRVSPMGPTQFMVSCVDSPQICAQEANRLCPISFDVVSNVTNPGDYGRMTMIVKCH